MKHGWGQYHVSASVTAGDPLGFLRLLSSHKISVTFLPNSFLQIITGAVNAHDGSIDGVDLKSLRIVISGGEAVVVQQGLAFLKCLKPYGLPSKALVPAFGMTETCAGCIFNLDFPHPSNQTEFAFVGHSPGPNHLEFRIVDSQKR